MYKYIYIYILLSRHLNKKDFLLIPLKWVLNLKWSTIWIYLIRTVDDLSLFDKAPIRVERLESVGTIFASKAKG